jgi:hypothetical protein
LGAVVGCDVSVFSLPSACLPEKQKILKKPHCFTSPYASSDPVFTAHFDPHRFIAVWSESVFILYRFCLGVYPRLASKRPFSLSSGFVVDPAGCDDLKLSR